MCCGSDLFVRLGYVHTFHAQEVQEVSAGSAVHCSCYHHIPVSDLSNGPLMSLNRPSLPLLYHGIVEQAQVLVWDFVRRGGVLSASFGDSDLDAVAAQFSADEGSFRLLERAGIAAPPK